MLSFQGPQRLRVQGRRVADDGAQGLLEVPPDGRDEGGAVIRARKRGQAEGGNPAGQESVGARLGSRLHHGVSF